MVVLVLLLVVFDQLLQEAGHEKIFLPFMAKGVQFITGDKVMQQNPQDVYEGYHSKLKQIKDAEERSKYINFR